MRDTIVLVNGQPMTVQGGGIGIGGGGGSTASAAGSTQKLPGPSILKNSSKTDLITSQQVWQDADGAYYYADGHYPSSERVHTYSTFGY